MSRVYYLRSLVWSLALLLTFISLAPAKEKDYRAKAHQAAAEITYLEQDQTIRRALAIGRSTGALEQKDVDTIVARLEKKQEVPATLLNTWQKLLRMSQTQTYLYDSKYFFPVGYEFETIHPGHVSSDEF